MCSVYFPSTPHCAPVSFPELHLHHVPWRTFFRPISIFFPLPLSPWLLFLSPLLFFFPCHKIMLFLVYSGGAQNNLQGMIKPKAWRGYLQEVLCWRGPTVMLLHSQMAKTEAGPDTLPRHSKTKHVWSSEVVDIWANTGSSQNCRFKEGCCKSSLKHNTCAYMGWWYWDGGTIFGRKWLVLGSYGEQMVNRLHCGRLSGMTAMRFPLRCHWSPFRRGEWLVGHGPS